MNPHPQENIANHGRQDIIQYRDKKKDLQDLYPRGIINADF